MRGAEGGGGGGGATERERLELGQATSLLCLEGKGELAQDSGQGWPEEERERRDGAGVAGEPRAACRWWERVAGG